MPDIPTRYNYLSKDMRIRGYFSKPERVGEQKLCEILVYSILTEGREWQYSWGNVSVDGK